MNSSALISVLVILTMPVLFLLSIVQERQICENFTPILMKFNVLPRLFALSKFMLNQIRTIIIQWKEPCLRDSMIYAFNSGLCSYTYGTLCFKLGISTKTECDYLNGWIKKRSHTQKSHPKVVNPRDTAGERKKKQTNPKQNNNKKTKNLVRRWKLLNCTDSY